MKTIYLDHAAATPLDRRVFEAMKPYFTNKFYNPSSLYLASKEVRSDMENARASVARLIGAKPGEIIFTAGGTEANNLAIKGIMKKYPDSNVIISAMEHESVIKPTKLFNHRIVKADKQGRISPSEVIKTIDKNTVLVSIMLANNEVGTIEPIADISSKIKEIEKNRLKEGNMLPLYLHTDACQAVNYLDIHVGRLGVDLMTLNGGKIYGPKQSGVLFVKTNIELEPLILGGGQENDMRSGTENVAQIIGFAKALEIAQASRVSEGMRLSELQSAFMRLLKERIPNSIINGSQKNRLPNNVHITIPGQDNERLIMMLDERGIECAAGSACSASNDEPSHALKAMGIGDEYAQSSLRFTMGRTTTAKDIKNCIEALCDCIKA